MVRALLFACLVPALASAQSRETADFSYQMSQTVQNSAAAQALQQIALRLALKDDGLEELAIARRDLTEEMAAARADTSLSPSERRRRMQELDTAMNVNARALETNFPAFRSIIAPDPLTIDEAQSLLAEDEALLHFHQGVDWLTIWMIARGEVFWHRLPVSEDDAAEIVSIFRADMGLDGTLRAAAALDEDEPEEERVTIPFNAPLATGLYELFFAAFRDELQAYPHLLIVADKSWIGLPFAALMSDPDDWNMPPVPSRLRAASWMGLEHAITVLPSSVSLRSVDSAGGRANTLMALGDPLFQGTASADDVARAASGATLADLAPLPGTRREVRAIAATFDDPQVLLGADATEGAIRAADLSATDVLVFATHGLIAGELQGLAEPALALTPPAVPTPEDDGLLTAGEVASLTLAADWVVLSACNTAAGDGEGAEGLSGLARAFFAAGAETLLVSHWPVRDDAAARLTASAFAELRAEPGLRKAEAMRRAMATLMQDTEDPSLAHPTAWAPFFVVGG